MSTGRGEISIELPQPEALTEGRLVDGDKVVYRSLAANSLFTVESVEGGTRVHNIIGNKSAPHAVSYSVIPPVGTTWIQYPDGSIVFRDLAGEMVAGIAPPWAADSNGKAIPSQFTYDGSTLTQTVNTQDLVGLKYPIVSDPYMGKNLFYDLNTRKVWKGQPVYSGSKTQWGQAIHNGSAGGSAGWIGGVAAGQYIMRNEGWREWTSKWGGRVTSRATFYQQYSCHVLGGFYNWAGDWNLEAGRRDNSWWGATVALHRCNW